MKRFRFSLAASMVALVGIALVLALVRTTASVRWHQSALDASELYSQQANDRWLEAEQRRKRAESEAEASRAPNYTGDAVTFIIEALDSEDDSVRRWAAHTLGRIGPDAKPAVPVLVKALKDKDPYVRREAAHTLGKIGPAATEAVPALREALRDSDVNVYMRARESIAAIDPSSPDGRSELP